MKWKNWLRTTGLTRHRYDMAKARNCWPWNVKKMYIWESRSNDMNNLQFTNICNFGRNSQKNLIYNFLQINTSLPSALNLAYVGLFNNVSEAVHSANNLLACEALTHVFKLFHNWNKIRRQGSFTLSIFFKMHTLPIAQ